MPTEISYRTKIVGLRKVVLRGKLDYFEADGWSILESDYRWQVLGEWLEKFDGKDIRLEIALLEADTDDHLLGDQVKEEYDELIDEDK